MADVEAIKRAHPEWNVVDAIDAPGGGVWAVGADGGVFALDAAGNASNATPFLGAYTTLDPTQRQGTRNFVAIQPDEVTGGYTLVSNWGERYNFRGPRAGDTTPGGPGSATSGPVAPGAPAPDPGDSAFINAMMSKLELGELGAWAFERYRSLGATPDAWETVQVEMQGQPQFQARFPGWEAAQRQGIRTPGEYIAYETAAFTMATRAGLPTDFVDRQDVAALMQGNVSLDELGSRINLASQAAYNAPPEVTETLSAWGISPSSLTAYYLNPEKATPFLERQFQAAQIGGASRTSGFGALNESEATRLAQQGMTQGQASQAFGEATAMRGLTEELLGESEDLNRGTQLSAIEGNAPAAEALERRRRQRQATFEGGGGSAGFGGQRSGLGSANS